MDDITYLRSLVWDVDAKVFETPFLERLLADCGNNVYRAASMALSSILGNQNKIKSLTRGNTTFLYDDLKAAIAEYKQMANDMAPGVVDVEPRRSY